MSTRKLPPIVIAFALFALMNGCAPVKEYQKQYLKDGEMELSARRAEKLEGSFQTYREGTSGGTGGKTGGGCGCN